MKILSVEQIQMLDAYTLNQENLKLHNLVEKAAQVCVKYLLENDFLLKSKSINIFAGNGNNGKDGFAIAKLLAQKEYLIQIYLLSNSNEFDDKFEKEQVEKIKKISILRIENKNELPKLDKNDLIIDAIFGAGLNRKIEGIYAEAIKHINKSESTIISIDIPSGMFCDKSSKENKGVIVQAHITLSFLPVKLAFLFAENSKYFGMVEFLDIGLLLEFQDKVDVKNYLITKPLLQPILKLRNKYSSKHDYGHALLITGSKGMLGAAVLSTSGALRSGVGLVTTHVPQSGVNILQITCPEAMVSIDENDNIFTNVKLLRYNAIGIGPGVGQDSKTATALKLLIQNYKNSLVFDADAINILAKNSTWLSFIPTGCIFTPHAKEFERLIGKADDDFERNNKQREFSVRYKAYVVLKGAYTAITCPDGSCYFNTTGNPGMAKGGSGDILTGLITGLLSQGYSSKQAAIMGVYLHGLAGDLAAEKIGEDAMKSGDIINYLGNAFLSLTQVSDK